MRRQLKQVLSRIWKGFDFHLKSPSVSWYRLLGSENIGASFGLIIENRMDLKISKGHQGVYRFNHIGEIGLSYVSLSQLFCRPAIDVLCFKLLTQKWPPIICSQRYYCKAKEHFLSHYLHLWHLFYLQTGINLYQNI